MSHHRHLAGLAAALALLGTGTAAAQTTPAPQKKVYCWNEAGRKVCGDALPANAVDSERTEFNARSGLATGQVGRALNDAERNIAAQAEAVAARQAAALAMQKRRDLAMVESYMTEDDLRRAYGERTELLDETLKASRLGISALRLSLLSLLRQAGDMELAGAPITRKLSDSIQRQHAELQRQRKILTEQELDRRALDSDLADSLRRYREMKQGQPDSVPAATPAATPQMLMHSMGR